MSTKALGPLHSKKVINPEQLTKTKPTSQMNPSKAGKPSLHTQGRPSTQVDTSVISHPEQRKPVKPPRSQVDLNKAGPAANKPSWSAS